MSFLVSYANIATITVPKISQAQIIKHVQQYLNNRKGCFYLFIPIFLYLCMKFYRMKPISRYSQKASGHARINKTELYFTYAGRR